MILYELLFLQDYIYLKHVKYFEEFLKDIYLVSMYVNVKRHIRENTNISSFILTIPAPTLSYYLPFYRSHRQLELGLSFIENKQYIKTNHI